MTSSATWKYTSFSGRACRTLAQQSLTPTLSLNFLDSVDGTIIVTVAEAYL